MPKTPDVEIIHFDALIHPDYNLKWSKDATATLSHIERREAWRERVQELVEDPHSALFYFSTFLRYRDGKVGLDLRGNNYPVIREDAIRRKELENLLGNRFIWFAGNHEPTPEEVAIKLQERRLTFEPQNTTLLAYGEYYDRCVGIWGSHLQQTLGIPTQNYAKLEKLSLETLWDPNAALAARYFAERAVKAFIKSTPI